MILKSLTLTNEESTKKKTLLVPVPQWGDDAEIMVTEMTVAGCIRLNKLTNVVLEMQGIDDVKRQGLLMCANLLSVMVHPDTGDFLLPETDLGKFYDSVNKDSFEALLVANGTLNPVKVQENLDTKKNNS